MKFEIAIISLEDSPRRDYIKLIPDYYINAVNGLNYSLDALQSKIKFHTGKEFITCRSVPFSDKWKIRLAIFLSHLKCLRVVNRTHHEINKLVIPPLLILEDDFKINYESPKDIPLPPLPDDWEILFLGGFFTDKKGHTEKPKKGWNYIDHSKIKFWTTSAYIIKDPVKLLKTIRDFGSLTTLDSYYNRWVFKKMKSYYLYPVVVEQNDLLESSIKDRKYILEQRKKQLRIPTSFFIGD